MWQGVIPAVTTKFTPDDALDLKEMERCYDGLMQAGCDGLIACGSLGEGPLLSHAERIEVLKLAKQVAGHRPALLTVAEAATRDACVLAEKAAHAGADGLMVVPGTIYHSNHRETVTALRAIAAAGDLPVMIYSNRLAYRVDVTTDMLEELADDARFVAVKESSDDIRRTTEIIRRLGRRYDVLTGVDNLAFEALTAGATGWVAGLAVAFPHETVAIFRLIRAGRYAEALDIYRWFRPLLDLDVSTYLVQNIKLVEALVTQSNERVRAPRLPLDGAQRERVLAVVSEALRERPQLPDVI
ncbi:dihydrodipicolinate synthase family protein [Undibacterium oligocarboniphilum]|uniref:Dihydrodipicolinate synthase family protein n=1 Tax=Undibacterium oligocarboniphilum TaxID=666702 RepID=A0A850QKC9_9BURK|nr:dihydrodipicolinate synthase family protein [Undibacterium oligocarboniphilum]MBC3868884.1 dihydrodipicolinate synthase family protein [Undibacterium oligocarboniphilum]NVO76864.1 dihydrodipicolinate synthase family protein [Undibacterium oligocarboniphilum]